MGNFLFRCCGENSLIKGKLNKKVDSKLDVK